MNDKKTDLLEILLWMNEVFPVPPSPSKGKHSIVLATHPETGVPVPYFQIWYVSAYDGTVRRRDMCPDKGEELNRAWFENMKTRIKIADAVEDK